jgi:copper resistance protein C
LAAYSGLATLEPCIKVKPMKRILYSISATAALLLSATAAYAHVHLVSSTPVANATVAAPARLTLSFSDTIVPAFSGFDLINSAGTAIAIRTSVSEDRKSISGVPAQQLAAGRYTINWRIAAGDGHRMTGSFAFTVR